MPAALLDATHVAPAALLTSAYAQVYTSKQYLPHIHNCSMTADFNPKSTTVSPCVIQCTPTLLIYVLSIHSVLDKSGYSMLMLPLFVRLPTHFCRPPLFEYPFTF